MKQESVIHSDFLEHVYPAELEEISRRRRTMDESFEDVLKGEPSVDMGLTGLAISGGGIRSATFSMGVIQALQKQGLLKSIDYISTVSGGGYTGSCISSVLNEPLNQKQRREVPFNDSHQDKEPQGLIHLRNSSNYLTPGGFIDKLRLGNVLLRGVLLNLFIYMPYILLAVILTEVAYEYIPHWDNFVHLIIPFTVLFLLMTIAFPLILRFGRKLLNWNWRNKFEIYLTIPPLIVLMAIIISPILFVTKLAIEHDSGQAVGWLFKIVDKTGREVGIVIFVFIAVMLIAGRFSALMARLAKMTILYLTGLIGPVIIFIIYLALCLWQIDSPYIDTSAESVLNDALDCEQPCIVPLSKNEVVDTRSAPAAGKAKLLSNLLIHPDVNIDSIYSDFIDALARAGQ